MSGPRGTVRSNPLATGRFGTVLQQPAVGVMLSAPQTRAELDENLRKLQSSGPLTSEEYAALAAHRERVRRHAGGFSLSEWCRLSRNG